MSIDETRNLVRQYIEKVWNHGDLTARENLTTESFTYQLGRQPERDRSSKQQLIGMTRTAFPEWRVDRHAATVGRTPSGLNFFARKWSFLTSEFIRVQTNQFNQGGKNESRQ